MIINLCNYISLWRSLPKSLCSRFSCSYHKSTSNIWLTTYLFIFKHKTNINLCIFIYFYSKLRIIKPSIITFRLRMITNLLKCLFSLITSIFLETYWTSSSISLCCPLWFNRIYLPILRKNFINSNFLKLNNKISKTHPPWSIWFFCFYCIFNIFFNSFELLPIISLLTERACPNSFISPRITHSYKL